MISNEYFVIVFNSSLDFAAAASMIDVIMPDNIGADRRTMMWEDDWNRDYAAHLLELNGIKVETETWLTNSATIWYERHVHTIQ